MFVFRQAWWRSAEREVKCAQPRSQNVGAGWWLQCRSSCFSRHGRSPRRDPRCRSALSPRDLEPTTAVRPFAAACSVRARRRRCPAVAGLCSARAARCPWSRCGSGCRCRRRGGIPGRGRCPRRRLSSIPIRMCLLSLVLASVAAVAPCQPSRAPCPQRRRSPLLHSQGVSRKYRSHGYPPSTDPILHPGLYAGNASPHPQARRTPSLGPPGSGSIDGSTIR